MNLPQELTITKGDLAGKYTDIFDCPLARALKRAGVNVRGGDGYYVGSEGRVGNGFYTWDTGKVFNYATLREGKLVYNEKTYWGVG